MRLKEITEEFDDYIVRNLTYAGKKTYPIFINPTGPELLSIIKDYGHEIRFIANSSNKKFYVFPHQVIHRLVATKYNIDYSENNTNDIFGEGEIKGNKIKTLYSDMIFVNKENKKFMDKILFNIEDRWEWTNRYSNLIEYLKGVKQKYENNKYIE